MNPDDYRAAVDSVSFRPDFTERTMARLEELAQKKECHSMNIPVAALAAALTVSLSTTAILLSPKDVANELGNPVLAAAFESENAVQINETQTLGDYHVTLAGLVSGEGLTEFAPDVERDMTYAVLVFERTDGEPLTDNTVDFTATPLVSGYKPWQVNLWTLNGSSGSFLQDGRVYTLYDCDSLADYSGHTIYYAVYAPFGMAPSGNIFRMDEDGSIHYQDGQEGILFTLPL